MNPTDDGSEGNDMRSETCACCDQHEFDKCWPYEGRNAFDLDALTTLAEVEVNEKPNTRDQIVRAVLDWIKSRPHLQHIPTGNYTNIVFKVMHRATHRIFYQILLLNINDRFTLFSILVSHRFSKC